MKAVTVRRIPRELAQVITRRARTSGTSVSKAVMGLLEEAAGLAKRKRGSVLHHDLDELAGSWGGEEASAFDRSLAELRSVDPDVWR